MGVHWLWLCRGGIYVIARSLVTLLLLRFELAHGFTVHAHPPSATNLYSKQQGHVRTATSKHGTSAPGRSIVPRNVTLDVLYEDNDMLLIDKPSGMIMQFVARSVESAVVFHLKQNGAAVASPWPWRSPDSFEGVVHRLDKDTSGLLVMAKHPAAASALHQSFHERRVRKRYLAITVGVPTREKLASRKTAGGVGDAVSPLGRHAQSDTATEGQKLLSKQIKQCGRDVDRAIDLLERTSDQSAANFNSVISMCKRAGDRDKALAVFDSMKERNVTPNIKCFVKAINLCAKKPPLCEKAIDLVGYMEDCGLPLDPNCISPAISACGCAGQIEPVLELLRRMDADERSKDFNGRVGCVRAAISACERCGASDSSLVLKERLRIMTSDRAEGCREKIASAVDLQAPNTEIVVDAPIGRLGSRRRRMGLQSADRGGRAARSAVTVLGFDGTLSVNSIAIETGRTHQIRVHMASVLGCPLVGDRMYNDNVSSAEGAERCMLHAAELTIPHPMTGDLLTFCCPPPPDFSTLVDTINSNSLLETS